MQGGGWLETRGKNVTGRLRELGPYRLMHVQVAQRAMSNQRPGCVTTYKYTKKKNLRMLVDEKASHYNRGQQVSLRLC